MQPFITVAIPLYNKKRFIENTIKSVLAQSHHNFELIVVDDGSTDGSLSIVENFFTDKRISVIKQNNSGVSAARNLALKSAKSDWVALLDADDQWTPNHLELIFRAVDACPDAAMISAHVRQISAHDVVSQNYNFDRELEPSYINYFNKATTNIFTITSSTVCLKKSAALAIGGFDEEIAMGEDLDMWARMALKYQVAHTNRITGLYLRNTGGTIDSTDPKSYFTLSSFEKFNPELIKLKYALSTNPTPDNARDIKRYINKKAVYGVLRALYLDNAVLAKTIARKYVYGIDARSLGIITFTQQPAPLIGQQLSFLRWLRRSLRNRGS